jgi:hypothetical protein
MTKRGSERRKRKLRSEKTSYIKHHKSKKMKKELASKNPALRHHRPYGHPDYLRGHFVYGSVMEVGKNKGTHSSGCPCLHIKNHTHAQSSMKSAGMLR